MIKKQDHFFSLYSPLTDIFNAIDKSIKSIGFSQFSPYVPIRFPGILENIAFPDFDCNISYPVSDCYIEDDGTCVIQIAVTGFKKEEIKINRENNIINITGKKIKKYKFDNKEIDKKRGIVESERGNRSKFRKENPDKYKEMEKKENKERKYLFRKIAQRDFDISYELSHKLDLDDIDISMQDGLLKIRIPMEESENTIKKEIKIK